MLKDNTLAPVLLFVFSRPIHTFQTLKALAANDLANQTDLIVYADAPRTEADEKAVHETREVVKAFKGFRSLTLIERPTNYGLARNIIEGVTEVCNRYGRVIVLEDDIVTSPQFLNFMNGALEHYKSKREVWHISGWNYPIETPGLEDAYFVRVMLCWGWATWSDRWKHYEKNTQKLIGEFDQNMIRRFDLGRTGAFWSQVRNNHRGRLNTWAIFWYATIFRHGGLCLNPTRSYVNNIGFDGTGTHGKSSDAINSHVCLNDSVITRFPDQISEDAMAIKDITAYYNAMKPSFGQRFSTRVQQILRIVRSQAR